MKKAAVRVGPESARIAVSGNSFCDSYIGQGEVKRRPDDTQAGGLVLEGTSDVNIDGNVFSSLRPKALSVVGDGPVRRILFTGNTITDSVSDVDRLHENQGCVTAGNILEADDGSP
jgi:hypothetical protein